MGIGESKEEKVNDDVVLVEDGKLHTSHHAILQHSSCSAIRRRRILYPDELVYCCKY